MLFSVGEMEAGDVDLGDVYQQAESGVARLQSIRRGESSGRSLAVDYRGQNGRDTLDVEKTYVFLRDHTGFLDRFAGGDLGRRARRRHGDDFAFQVRESADALGAP